MVWLKIKEFVEKYWYWLIGAVALIILLVRQAFEVSEHRDVLENEVKTNEKIDKINEAFAIKIKAAEVEALMAHDDRELKIKEKEIRELKSARNEVVAREKDNNSVSGDELARRFGITFGADVVEVDNENE
jgi:dipeptidase